MTHQQHRHIQICNLIIILILALTIAFVPADANAEAFSSENIIITNADNYFEKALNTNNQKERKNYFQKACERYYMITQKDPTNIHSHVQIGRIYTIENNKQLAQKYLFAAQNMEPDNAVTNFYLGDYYYSEKKYKKALELYQKAYKNGLDKDFSLNYKIGKTYEKLGDLLKANSYYKRAYLADFKNEEIPDKIRSIEAENYKNSGYYDFKRK